MPGNLNDYIPLAEAAKDLGVKSKTMCKWQTRGYGPTPHKVSGRVFYLRGEVRDWVRVRAKAQEASKGKTVPARSRQLQHAGDGRLRENRELSDRVQEFVKHFTETSDCIGKPEPAALAAGYSPSCAGSMGRQLLKDPRVQAALRDANMALMGGDLTTLSLQRLRQILERDDVHPKVHLDAAKVVLDRAGYVAPKAADPDDGQPKEPSDMSQAELEGFIRQKELALNRMKDITPTALLEGEVINAEAGIAKP